MIDAFYTYVSALIAGAQAKAVIAFVAAIVLAVFGQSLLAYEILFILVVIDFILGFTFGVKIKKVSSRRTSRTLYKMLVYFLLILAAHQLTRYADFLLWLEQFLVLFMAVTEMLSIIENAHKLGIPIPIWVTEKLSHLLDRDDALPELGITFKRKKSGSR